MAKNSNGTNSSATLRKPKSHSQAKEPRKTNSTRKPHTIDANLKRRARLLLSNSSIPGQTRSLIRYALEIRDRHLAQLVRRVEMGEMTIDHLHRE